MKIFYISLLLLAAFLSGCGYYTFNYIGSSPTPVHAVEIHVDESTIKRKYEIIGKGYAGEMLKGNSLVNACTKKTKEKGADAVFFRETDHLMLTTVMADSSRMRQAAPVYTTATRTEILFIKYID